MAEVSMKQMGRIAAAVARGGFPLLIRGRHGIGKSEFVYQLAKEMSQILECDECDQFEVIEQRASLMTEGDLTGLPYKGPVIHGHDSTKFNPPDWFLRACEKPAILFFDEVDRGIMEVRQGIFQINDSHSLNGVKLHPLTRVIACINGGIHGTHYQVGDFDPAELDRYTVYDLEPTIEEWAEYCWKNDVMPEIINFCVDQPKFLEILDAGAHDPSKINPSRRSWVRLSETLSKMEEFEDGISEGENSLFMNVIAQGFVGVDAAAAFRNYALEYKRTVDPEKVVYEGALDEMDNMSVSDYAEYTHAFIKAGIMKNTELTEAHFSNIRKSIGKMPTEALIIFWQTLCTSHEFVVENIHKLGWDFDNKETELEQVEFTRVITHALIDPPEDEDIQAMIQKVTDEKAEKENVQS